MPKSFAMLVAALVLLATPAARADGPDDAVEALQQVQDVVGQWDGDGAKADKTAAWAETVDSQWKFGKNGKVSIYLTFKAKDKAKERGRLLDEAMLTWDAAKNKYRLKAYPVGGGEAAIEFEGALKKNTLTLDRVNKGKSKDDLDRLDLKVINDGDRVVYTAYKRVGQSKRYTQTAQVGLNRQGTSLASREASGPKCIVTGGAGIMTVSYEGQTYYVCCTGCRDEFTADPKKYVEAASKGKK